MIKICKSPDCETTVDGNEEEVAKVFRKMKRDGCFRGICKKCEYELFKSKYYKRPSLRRNIFREDLI